MTHFSVHHHKYHFASTPTPPLDLVTLECKPELVILIMLVFQFSSWGLNFSYFTNLLNKCPTVRFSMPIIHADLKKFQLLLKKVEKAVLCTCTQYTYRWWLFWCGFLFYLFFSFEYVVQSPGLDTVTERWQDIAYAPRMFPLPSLQVTNAFTVIPMKWPKFCYL